MKTKFALGLSLACLLFCLGGQVRIWCNDYGTPKIHNSIVWNNGSVEIELDDPIVVPVVTYCDVKGGWPRLNQSRY